MTREEAIKIIRKMLAYTDLTVRANLNADMVSACNLAIKALEQESFIDKPCVSSGVCEHDKQKTLDKLRAEIIARDRNVKAIRSDSYCFFTAEEVLKIINKYKAESEKA